MRKVICLCVVLFVAACFIPSPAVAQCPGGVCRNRVERTVVVERKVADPELQAGQPVRNTGRLVVRGVRRLGWRITHPFGGRFRCGE